MELKDYNPTFRNVLFEKRRPEKTNSGILIPEADFSVITYSSMFENDKEHKPTDYLTELVVIKAGKDCQEIKEGDVIILSEGIRPQIIDFSDVGALYTCMEMQITGYARK
jgi:hypothetical protein